MDPSEDCVTRGAMRATHLTLVKLKIKEKEKIEKTERRKGEERRERGKRRSTFFLT